MIREIDIRSAAIGAKIVQNCLIRQSISYKNGPKVDKMINFLNQQINSLIPHLVPRLVPKAGPPPIGTFARYCICA